MDGWADEKRIAADPDAEEGIKHALWVERREKHYNMGDLGVGGKGWSGTFSSTFCCFDEEEGSKGVYVQGGRASVWKSQILALSPPWSKPVGFEDTKMLLGAK